MYSLLSHRGTLFELVANTFRELNVSPAIAELGVHSGINAESLIKIFEPSSVTLVDSWSSSEMLTTYSPFEELPDWIIPLAGENSPLAKYFNGPIDQQATFDRLYLSTIERMRPYGNVSVLRQDTHSAFKKMQETRSKLDYVYVDANHQYEYVLRDLLEWSSLLSRNGCMQLNDCVHSDMGVRQNLGVLGALNEFTLRNQAFVPLMQTRGPYADVLICHKDSLFLKPFRGLVDSSSLPIVEVSDESLFRSRFANGRMCYV